MTPSASDEQLALKAAEGDKDAFLELYERYLPKVYNRVKSRVPLKDAEDVTQEIFIAVVRSIGKFEKRSRFNTWLYTIVNRSIADYFRKFYRRADDQKVQLENDSQQFQMPSYEHEHLDERVLIQRALDKMPDHYREIILLRFADGLTFRQIAEVRGQSLEAAKSLYRRAIEAVRNQIGEN